MCIDDLFIYIYMYNVYLKCCYQTLVAAIVSTGNGAKDNACVNYDERRTKRTFRCIQSIANENLLH